MNNAMTTLEQLQIINESALALKRLANRFRTMMETSRFEYDEQKYRTWLDQLKATSRFCELHRAFNESDPTFRLHMAFLKAGVHMPLCQLQDESLKNVRDEEGEGLEHNKLWDYEMHQMKNTLHGILGHMDSIRECAHILTTCKNSGTQRSR